MKKKVSLMILATIPLIITSQARALNLTPTKFAELEISHAYVVGEYLFNSDKGFSPELRDVMIASRSIPEGEKTTYYDIQYDEEENTFSIIEIYSKEEKTADELNSMTVKYIYSDCIRDSEPEKNI